MTDDFPRDRSANPADADDDLHDEGLRETGADDDTSSEAGLEDRNVGLEVDADRDDGPPGGC